MKRASSTRKLYAKQDFLNDYYGQTHDDLYEDGYYGQYDDKEWLYLKGYMAGFKAAQQSDNKILRSKYRN